MVALVVVAQHLWKHCLDEVGVEAMLVADGLEVSILVEDQSTESFALEVGTGRVDKRD